MMKWVFVVVCFLAYVPVFWFGFVLYARALRFAGELGGYRKLVLAMAAYLAFSCVFLFTIILLMMILSPWENDIRTNAIEFGVVLILYILSITPAVVNFKKKYLDDLKKYGFF